MRAFEERIEARILRYISENYRINCFRLSHHSGLDWRRFVEYIDHLIAEEMVKIERRENGQILFSLGTEGIFMLEYTKHIDTAPRIAFQTRQRTLS